MKTDQFTTRDVVDMIIDDIEDPLASLNKSEVRGFIKTKTEKKKRKKKGGNKPGSLRLAIETWMSQQKKRDFTVDEIYAGVQAAGRPETRAKVSQTLYNMNASSQSLVKSLKGDRGDSKKKKKSKRIAVFRYDA